VKLIGFETSPLIIAFDKSSLFLVRGKMKINFQDANMFRVCGLQNEETSFPHILKKYIGWSAKYTTQKESFSLEH
jgi:hypothetical protein